MRYMSVATATKLGEAFAYMAYELGAVFMNGKNETCVDCVGLEETDVYAKLCDEFEEQAGDLENNELYDAFRVALYEHATKLGKEKGVSPR